MGPKTQELINILDNMIDLLHENHLTSWPAYLLKVNKRLKGSDFSGIGLFLNAFGGMGSINDVVLGYDVPSIPGEIIWKKNTTAVNEAFQSMLTKAHGLADDIQRDNE